MEKYAIFIAIKHDHVKMNTLFYAPDFSPVENVIDRGEYRGFGYVIGDEATKTVLYIFQERDLALSTVFGGKDSVSFKDSQNVTRVLERKNQGNQMVFYYNYGEEMSLERVKSDLSVFVDAIRKRIDEYIQYCMTHDN